jgi:hypothetical protein
MGGIGALMAHIRSTYGNGSDGEAAIKSRFTLVDRLEATAVEDDSDTSSSDSSVEAVEGDY